MYHRRAAPPVSYTHLDVYKRQAQAKDDGMGEFISCDDLMARSGVGKSVVDSLREAGALGDLPESNQISLF